LKQIIGSEVAAANAPEIPVTLRADDDSMGLPSPYGDNNFKVGVEYSITTTVGQDYTFLAWTHNGEDDDVTFGDAGAVTTTVVVNREVEGLVIAPTFDQRPKIVTWTPFSGSSGNLTNQDITVTFSEPILDSCAVLHAPESGEGTITVTSVKTARITTDTPVNVESSFIAEVNGSALTIALKEGVYHDIFSTVSVTLSSDFCDLAGNAMVEDFSWFFTTGSGADETGPSITAFSIATASGGETAIGDTVAYTTDTELTLRVFAEDDQGAVTQMRVIETPWSSGSSSGGATGSAIEHGETDYLQQSTVTLSASDNTWTRVQVQVADTAFNWSSLSPETDRNTKYVYRDLGAPSVDTFAIAGGDSYTSSTSPAVSVTVSDAGIGGIEYALTSSTAMPGSWSDTAPTTTTLSGGDGEKTRYLHVRDAFGNAGYQSDSIILDRQAPSGAIDAISTTGNPGWVRNGQSVSIDFTVTDSASGVAGTPMATIAGQPATVTGVAGSYTASYDFSGTSVAQGAVSYTIDAVDNAGNSMTQLSGSTGIIYDRDPPSVSIGAPSVSHAAEHDTVTFDVTYGADAASISLAQGDVTINAGGDAGATVNPITGSDFTRTVTVEAGSGDGGVGISIASDTATDAAGNSAAGAGPSATFAVDNTGPSITGASLTADATSITGLTTSDSGSGVDTGTYTLSGGSGGTFNGSSMTGLTAPAQGSHTDYVIGADDNLGNPGEVTVRHSRDSSDNYTATIQ
jgi:hypothetical protein